MIRSRDERAVFNKERPIMRRTCDLRQALDPEMLNKKRTGLYPRPVPQLRAWGDELEFLFRLP
jgi:hypothetical protein